MLHLTNRIAVLAVKCFKQEFEALIVSEKPDIIMIIALTEIFQKTSLFDPVEEYYNIEGYDTIRTDLTVERGIVLYIKTCFCAIKETFNNGFQ